MARYTALCAWLGVSPGRFFMQVAERELSPLEHAITHLQADPRLTAQAAGKISSVLKDLSTTPSPPVRRVRLGPSTATCGLPHLCAPASRHDLPPQSRTCAKSLSAR